MNGVVKEWIDKAEGDFAVALREYRVRKNACHDAVCFHRIVYRRILCGRR